MDAQYHTPDQIEDADFRQLTNPSSTIVFPQGATRADVILTLSKNIPTTPEFGNLPLFYIRSDLLNVSLALSQGYLNQDEAESAAEPLDYTEGFPTLPHGSPFWTQLAHEPLEAHILFKAFIDLGETDGIRLLDTLATREQVDLSRLRELYGEYYWGPRARAFDLFIVAADRKRKEARRRKVENEHYNIAGGLLDKFVSRFNSEPDLISKLEPKELLDSMEMMIKIQRLSLGLSANANAGEVMTPGASVEVIMRSLTKNVGLSEEAQGGFGNRIATLLSDPETAMQAQELVIRATSAGNAFPNG